MPWLLPTKLRWERSEAGRDPKTKNRSMYFLRVRSHSADSKLLISGDYLTAVFCYCQYPQKVEEVMGPAHFYQFEYYNVHHDTTFILTSACPDGDIGFDKFCVPSKGGKNLLTGGTMGNNCKTWDGYEAVGKGMIKRSDEFCYLPHKHDNDYITFNFQKRNLTPGGNQEPVVANLEPGTCESLCRENMDMDILQGDAFPPSHQVEWTKIDDMCWDCK